MYLSNTGDLRLSDERSQKFNSVMHIRASTFADTPVVRLLWMGC